MAEPTLENRVVTIEKITVPMVERHDKDLYGDEDNKLNPKGRGMVEDVRDYRAFMAGMRKIAWLLVGELAVLIFLALK